MPTKADAYGLVHLLPALHINAVLYLDYLTCLPALPQHRLMALKCSRLVSCHLRVQAGWFARTLTLSFFTPQFQTNYIMEEFKLEKAKVTPGRNRSLKGLK